MTRQLSEGTLDAQPTDMDRVEDEEDAREATGVNSGSPVRREFISIACGLGYLHTSVIEHIRGV